jgi:hypothetical protein
VTIPADSGDEALVAISATLTAMAATLEDIDDHLHEISEVFEATAKGAAEQLPQEGGLA